ncbi:MAG TPA: YqgE/AlgH family protein [Opitutaceae bacterium]
MKPRRAPRSEYLAGSLLLAHPSLRDGNFRRTVVLLSSHDEDGAVGVVLNRPLGRRLGEVSPVFALGPLASVPVYSGGPVQPEQLLLCAWRILPDEGGFRLHFGLDPAKAEELAGTDDLHFRAFLGYSGWSAGQLENEMEHNTWVVTGIPGDLGSYSPGEGLWRELLAGIDHEWKLLADEPEDPSAN